MSMEKAIANATVTKFGPKFLCRGCNKLVHWREVQRQLGVRTASGASNILASQNWKTVWCATCWPEGNDDHVSGEGGE